MSRFPLNRIADHGCCRRQSFRLKPQASGDALLASACRLQIEVLRIDGEAVTEFRLDGSLTQTEAAELLATFTAGKRGDE